MTKQFVWILANDSPKSLKKSGISESYIIPVSNFNGLDKSVCPGKIWLIVRGRSDRIVALLNTKRVERFINGYHQGDYLLHVDINLSFRLTSASILGEDKFHTKICKDFGAGVSEISHALAEQLWGLTLSVVQTKLASPLKATFSKIQFNQVSSGKRLASLAISKITQNFNLDELWGSRVGTKLNPFAFFAYRLLLEKFNEVPDSIIEILSSNTLLEQFHIDDFSKGNHLLTEWAQPRMVDLSFTEVNPEMLFAREFIASSIAIDLEASLAKTEIAEKLHQNMLRDICVHLKAIGIIPFETTSIDLIIENDGTKFYEIKSTNDNNIFAQCAKGAFQIAYYAEAVKRELGEGEFALIIHKTKNNLMESECVNTLRRLGVRCLIYDPNKQWPERVQNLLLSK